MRKMKVLVLRAVLFLLDIELVCLAETLDSLEFGYNMLVDVADIIAKEVAR